MNWEMRILISVFVGTAMSILAAPGLMNYQGRLTDTEGRPVTTDVDVTFTFYDAETGGTQLGSGFSDTDTVTPDAAGVYSTLIGDDPGNLIPASIFTGDSVWLNVNVGGEDLVPRKRITSVGYAMQSGSAADVKKVVRDFVVARGESVDAGDVVTFLSGAIAKHDAPEVITQSDFNKGGTHTISTARLSDSSFVIAYRDVDNSQYGTVNIGTITHGTISWMGESVFLKDLTSNFSVASLSGTEFVVAYQDYQDWVYRGTARTGSISGGSVSWGDESVFAGASSHDISVAALNDKEFIICYYSGNAPYAGSSLKGTVSSGGLTWGTKHTFNLTSTSDVKIAGLTGNRFAVAFKSDNKSYVKIGEVSGTDIEYGPGWEIYPDSVGNLSLTALSEKTIVVAYRYLNGMVRVGEIAGMKVNWGDDVLFSLNDGGNTSITRLSETQYVLAHCNSVNDYGEMLLGTVSGNQTFISPITVFNSEQTDYISAAGLTPGDFIIGFYNDGSSKTGSACLGKSYGTVIGIADAAGTSGKSVPVILDGISDLHTGLEIGKTYYAGEDGTLVDDSNAPRIGKALSNRELLLDVRR